MVHYLNILKSWFGLGRCDVIDVCVRLNVVFCMLMFCIVKKKKNHANCLKLAVISMDDLVSSLDCLK